MFKKEMILAVLESMGVEENVLMELKQCLVDNEDQVQAFIVSVNQALRQEIRSACNDWSYLDSLSFSLLLVSGLLIMINAGFSLGHLGKTAQTVIWMLSRIGLASLTSCSILLHQVRRQVIREYIPIISDILSRYYVSLRMKQWRQRRIQQDIVEYLEAWEFKDLSMITRLKTNWIDLGERPGVSTVKIEDFVRCVKKHRLHFQAHLQAMVTKTGKLLALCGGTFLLSGSVLLERVSCEESVWKNPLLLSGMIFCYHSIRWHYAAKTGQSRALAEWDLHAMDHLLATLSEQVRQPAMKTALFSVPTLNKHRATSLRPTAGMQIKKGRLPKTKTCSVRFQEQVFRLWRAAVSIPVVGYQYLASAWQWIEMKKTQSVSADSMFQELMAAEEKKRILQLRSSPLRKQITRLPRKKRKSSPNSNQCMRFVAVTEKPQDLKKAPVISSSGEKFLSDDAVMPVEAPSPEKSMIPALPAQIETAASALTTVVSMPVPAETAFSTTERAVGSITETAALSLSTEEDEKGVFPSHPEPLSSEQLFSPEEEKMLLIQRVALAERAFRLHYGRALSAEEYIRHLQRQLAQAVQAVHYWQWRSTLSWRPLFFQPRPETNTYAFLPSQPDLSSGHSF